jgi:hypothetical protein
MFRNGYPSRRSDQKTFEVITSTWSIETLGSVASLLAATLCQENPDRNHKLSNFGSTEREKIKWLKEGINGWDVLFTNNQSLG